MQLSKTSKISPNLAAADVLGQSFDVAYVVVAAIAVTVVVSLVFVAEDFEAPLFTSGCPLCKFSVKLPTVAVRLS